MRGTQDFDIGASVLLGGGDTVNNNVIVTCGYEP